MRLRSGFTLVEVLIAAIIMVIALAGILGAAFNTLAKSQTTEEYQIAALMAAERLAYFRAQKDPYKAVGGTFYDKPSDGADAKYYKDFNSSAEPLSAQVHLLANTRPRLFVREVLFGSSESRYNGVVFGSRIDQGKLATAGRSTVGINVIPETPTEINVGGTVAATGGASVGGSLVGIPYQAGTTFRVTGIIPNLDNASLTDGARFGGVRVAAGSVARFPGHAAVTGFVATLAQMHATVPGADNSNRQFAFVPAPRCNEILATSATTGGPTRKAQGGYAPLPDGIRYIREVWIQTNNPAGAAGADTWPDGSTAKGFAASGNLLAFNDGVGARPTSITSALPPWCVAVTVRVFARDKRVQTLNPDATAAYDRPSKSGFGYDPRRPLASVVGYFSHRSRLQ